MAAQDHISGEGDVDVSSSSPPRETSSSYGWKTRIFVPTIIAGIVGAGTGLVSKHRKVHGLANISATYAANFAIVTGCYCGAREFVMATRKTGSDDPWNSALAGFGSGALLGRLQGGQLGAVRYSIAFAVVGTAADYAVLKFTPVLRDYTESIFGNNENLKKDSHWWKLPDWFPIQVLDEEALAAKKAQEQQFLAQRARIRELSKEES